MPTIAIDGKNCFYQEIGEGYPLLFGHSYLWSSAMWEPQLKTLSRDFHCIAPDLWDHGRSDRLGTKRTSIEQLADHAWQLMHRLGHKEFGVVGLSVGGMWGAQLALDHPEAVTALVLMDTYVGKEALITQQKYFGMLDWVEREKRFSDLLLNQVVPLFFSPKTLANRPQMADDFSKSLSAIPEERIPGIVSIGRAIFSRNCLLEKLPQIAQPTLVLVGKDDIPRPPKEAQEMAALLPDGELGIIEQAGHISCLEQPERVNAWLFEFLTRQCVLR